LATPADRERALDLVLDVAGPADEMAPETLAVIARLRAALELAPPATPASTGEARG
jgi:hypothetical protein